MRSDVVRARVSHNTKIAAERVLNSIGLTMSEAINLTLIQIKIKKALPFELVAEPNQETVKAIKEAQANIGVKQYKSLDDYFEKMGINVNAKISD